MPTVRWSDDQEVDARQVRARACLIRSPIWRRARASQEEGNAVRFAWMRIRVFLLLFAVAAGVLVTVGAGGDMRPGSKRDNARPSTPLGVRISSSGWSTILAWEPSIDNKRVVAYDVRFASHRARVVAPEVRVNGGTCGRIANVRVVAIDRAGNRSRPATATVRVGGCAQAAPGWFGGFETGDISEWDYLHAAAPERFQVVRSDQGVTPRQGNHMARVEVRGGEPASWDASMNASLAQKDNLPNVGLGNDVYMGWSVYIPRNFRYVPNGGSNLIMEWHADASMRQAPFHFGINGYNGRFFVDLHTAATGFSPVLHRDVGRLVTGRWVDCVVRTKWAQDASGVFEFWMDGVKKVSWTGRTWGTQQVVYPVAGYYRTNYNATAVLYIDALKVGTTYTSVAP